MSTAKTLALMVGGTLAWIVGAAYLEARSKERHAHVQWTDKNRWE